MCEKGKKRKLSVNFSTLKEKCMTGAGETDKLKGERSLALVEAVIPHAEWVMGVSEGEEAPVDWGLGFEVKGESKPVVDYQNTVGLICSRLKRIGKSNGKDFAVVAGILAETLFTFQLNRPEAEFPQERQQRLVKIFRDVCDFNKSRDPFIVAGVALSLATMMSNEDLEEVDRSSGVEWFRQIFKPEFESGEMVEAEMHSLTKALYKGSEEAEMVYGTLERMFEGS